MQSFITAITRPPPADPQSTSCAGRTVIITGSNTGLGLAAAIKFALLEASHIILGVRDAVKGETARNQIESAVKEQNDSSVKVDVWSLDMGNYESIKAFAARASTELERLDIVVLNAGVNKRTYTEGNYGFEETLQVNVLGTTLLALLLLPILRRSGKKFQDPNGIFPVLEIVSSGLYKRVTLTDEERSGPVDLLKGLSKPDGYGAHRQYSISKLLLMCAFTELKNIGYPDVEGQKAAAIKNHVWVTSVCPGLCSSNLARDYMDSMVNRMLFSAAGMLMMRTVEQGARTYVSGTILGAKGHGEFWQHDMVQTPAEILNGEQGERFQKRVWKEIVDALSRDVPSFSQLLLDARS